MHYLESLFMEKLMQYIWEYRLWNPAEIQTNDGRKVRIIDPGRRNDDAGPDFFNAKIEIDGFMWAGNVEIHYRASDWKRHGHDKDKSYDSVILHVVDKDDAPVYRTNGERIPQIVMHCSPKFNEKYSDLVNAKVEIPCKTQIAQLTGLERAEWLESMAFERLRDKSSRIKSILDINRGDWEEACYITFARTLGFGINNDAFELLAKSLPLNLLHKHSDSMLQLEAFFFGQAGMLNEPSYAGDHYYDQLCREYNFLKNKFSLRQPEGMVWKTLRMRPQNFPCRRIAALAHYVFNGFRLMADILDAKGDYDKLVELFKINLSGYWDTHYSFSHESPRGTNALGPKSIDILLINVVAPLYYLYGETTDNYDMVEYATSLLELLKPERNRCTILFTNAGLKVENALDSQAVVQIYKQYCQQRKCLYCHVGHKLLSVAASET